MLIKATSEHVEVLAEYAWRVFQDPSKRTTPPFKSQEEIQDYFNKIVLHKTDLILAYYENEKLEGVMALNLIHENRYMQTAGGPYIANTEKYDTIASIFMDYLKTHGTGYECYFGLPRTNIAGRNFLEAQCFKCTEDTVQMRITPEQIKHIETDFEVVELSEQYHEAYRKFHNTHFSDYYWNSERLFSALNQWFVHLAMENGEIIGSIFTRKQSDTNAEIYGCTVLPLYMETDLLQQLIYLSSTACINQGIQEILYFEEEDEKINVAVRLGYEIYDTYMCYHKNNY